MKSMIDIEKRLGEIVKKSRKGPGPDLDYCSRPAALAQLLTGVLICDRELSWDRSGHIPCASDGQKLKWIRQITPARLAEIRREWDASLHERDKIALLELDRLMSPMLL